MSSTNVTRRLAHSLSYVVLSSSPSGQLTLPLVDPTTGRLEHYTLVRVGSPILPSTSLASVPTKGEAKDPKHGQSSRRTLSESGLLSRPAPTATGTRVKRSKNLTDTEQRLARLAEEYLLDISPSALRIAHKDTDWPFLSLESGLRRSDSSSSSSASLSLPPSPQLKRAASFARFDACRSSQSFSYEGTPSLVDAEMSQPSMFSSPSLSLARRLVRPARMKQRGVDASESAKASASTSTSTSTPQANDSVLIGLGILGMSNADGSPFSGLGVLPRTHHIHTRATSTPGFPPSASANTSLSWNWAADIRHFSIRPDLTGTSEDTHFADEPLEPEALFWRDATAADFRRRLDDALSVRKVAGSRLPASPAVRANGSLKMVRHRERRSRATHFGMPSAPAVDDVFLSTTSGSMGCVGSNISTSMLTEGRSALGFQLFDVIGSIDG